MLIANSLNHLRKMKEGFQKEYKAAPTKQTINRQREVEVGEMKVEIIAQKEQVHYLEQLITFKDQDSAEVDYRVGCASSAIEGHRQELTCK